MPSKFRHPREDIKDARRQFAAEQRAKKKLEKQFPPAGPDETKKDFDGAFASAKAAGLIRPYMLSREALAKPNPEIQSVLFSVLTGRVGDHHPWLAHEDANYVLNHAKKLGWYNQLATEAKMIRISKSQLRSLVKEVMTLREGPMTGDNWSGIVQQEIDSATRVLADEVYAVYEPDLDQPVIDAIKVDIRLALSAAVDSTLEKVLNDIDAGKYNA